MNWLFLVVVIAVAVFVALIKAKKPSRPAGAEAYERQPSLFTPAERSFLGVLEQAVDPEHRVLGKVRLADVIRPKTGTTGGVRQSAQNRIDRKHLDFLVCRKDDLAVACAVELDDASHGARKRKERDAFVEQALASAGVPLVRFPARRAYVIGDLRMALANAIGVPEIAGPVAVAREEPSASDAADTGASVRGETGAEGAERDGRLCPKCGAEMVLRVASRGNNQGQRFWGCSSYPTCRGVLPDAACPPARRSLRSQLIRGVPPPAGPSRGPLPFRPSSPRLDVVYRRLGGHEAVRDGGGVEGQKKPFAMGDRSERMGHAQIEQEIVTELHKLPPAGQQQVLAFVKALAAVPSKGVPGRNLLQFVGTIGTDDLSAMERAIETACERVNRDDW